MQPVPMGDSAILGRERPHHAILSVCPNVVRRARHESLPNSFRTRGSTRQPLRVQARTGKHREFGGNLQSK